MISWGPVIFLEKLTRLLPTEVVRNVWWTVSPNHKIYHKLQVTCYKKHITKVYGLRTLALAIGNEDYCTEGSLHVNPSRYKRECISQESKSSIVYPQG